ncbi:MAG: uridine kinase [Candidatus Diapherotrites archaeon]|nr:uridine kinase [Candidatus Diapherotrites archaeon]
MVRGLKRTMNKKIFRLRSFSFDSGLCELNKIVEGLLRKKSIVIIGISGGSGAGKTHLSKKIGGKILPMDDYYKGLAISGPNFDCPDALDLKLLKEHLCQLKKGHTIKKPVYDFKTHSRAGYEDFTPDKIIIVDGLFAISKELASELDLKVFVDSPKKKRLARRIERDVKERGRTRESVIKQFTETVEPMHKKYVEPCKRIADIIIKN